MGKCKERRIEELLSLWLDGKSVCVIEMARDILKEYPSDFSVLNILGVALVSIDRFEDAHRVIQLSIRVAPREKQYLALSAMAFMYYQKGAYSDAVKWYKKAFAASSPRVEDLVFIGICLMKQGELSEAKLHLHKAINEEGNKAEDAYFYYGVVLRAEEKYSESLKYFKEALRIDPSYEDARDSILDIKELKNSKGQSS